MGDSHDRVAAAVGLTAGTEARVVPGCLCETVSSCRSYNESEAYLTRMGDTLLEDLGLLPGDGRGNGDGGQRTDKGS